MANDFENRLVKAIQEQVDKINYHCSAKSMLPDLAVHEIRKSFKRIRAFLAFYPESLDESLQDYSKQIKSLAKFLAPARESFVNLQLLDKLASGGKLFSQQKCQEIKDLMVEENKTLIDDLNAEKKIFSEIKSFVYLMEARLFGILFHPSVKIDALTQISISYEKGYVLFNGLGTNYEAELYHDLRKTMKTIWYQFDLAKADQPKLFSLTSNALDKITEQLGQDHDWHIFRNELKKDVYNLKTSQIEVLDQKISSVQKPNLNKLLPRLQEFFMEPPDSFEEKMRTIYNPQV